IVTVKDHENPTIACPANITVDTAPGTCSSNVTFNATASDNCGTANVTCTPPSGSTFPKGTSTVTCHATDASGNNSADCTFTVTVSDNQAPTVTCPANITTTTAAGSCESAPQSYTSTASDNCVGSTTTCTPPSGSTFPKGTTTVTCHATDVSGNNSADCSFTVTVSDSQAPTVTCPADIATTTAPGSCESAPQSYTAMPSDNCVGSTTTCTPPSGSTFPKGTTTVTCHATDASGNNSADCTFTVTV